MNDYLEVKIIGIKPEATYMDRVYEQTVEVELLNGIKIGLFDSLPKVTSELLGKRKHIVILASISEIEKVSKTRLGIKPLPNDPLSWRNHSYYGKVAELDVDDEWHKGEIRYHNLVLLDVGEGHILVDVDKEQLKTVDEGDYVKVLACRTDLIHVD